MFTYQIILIFILIDFLRSLGYHGGRPFKEAHFGNGEGQIWIDEIGCAGDEPSLVDCPRLGWGINDCMHSEDAGVSCNV